MRRGGIGRLCGAKAHGSRIRVLPSALALAFGLAAAGCSSDSSVLSSIGLGSSSNTSNQTLVGTPHPSATAAATGPSSPNLPDPQTDCPSVTVRSGTSTFTINSPGADPNVLDVRYQGTIENNARECVVTATTMTMKVGIMGRVIVGPAGGPGVVTVPLRIAVVREGPSPETIVSKFHALQLGIAAGQPSVPFTYVDNDVTFPTPTIGEIQAYIVYIGFDPQGEPKAKPKAKSTAKKPPRKKP